MEKAIFIFLLLSFTTANTQTLEWANSFGGTDNDLSGSVKIDAEGNVYNVYGIVHPGDAVVHVQKRDAAGNLLWDQIYGGGVGITDLSMTVDDLGNVYVAGSFYDGYLEFYSSGFNLILSSGSGFPEYIVKLNASGNFSWVKRFDAGQGFVTPYSLSVDNSGNVYATGEYNGTADFDPGTDNYELTASMIDVFVQKVDSAGNFVWAKSIGGTWYNSGLSIDLDPFGNPLIAGYFQGTADFDPGSGTNNITSVDMSTDVFVLKLNSSGNFIWVKTFGGSGTDIGRDICIDATGNYYVSGEFEETCDFNPGAGTSTISSVGNEDAFVQKMNAFGNFLWVKTFGGMYEDIARSIDVDIYGNLYSTGSFSGITDFAPGLETLNLSSFGYDDVYVLVMNSLGELIWVKQFGGTQSDKGEDITVDDSGNIYTSGLFNGIVDFDPGNGTMNLTSIGASDAFIQKMRDTSLIGDVESSSQINVFPNPSTGTIQILFEKNEENIEIELMDPVGNVIFEGYYQNSTYTFLELTGASGIYFLHVKSSVGKRTTTIVKI